MERERHEPTFGKPDLHDVHFRSDRSRPIRRTEQTSPWIYMGVGAALLIAIAMGLIEWNARRQAAAMTRELTRPMTAKEEAQFKADMQKFDQEFRAALQQAAPQPRVITLPAADPAPQPLRPGERCIQGRRFERIEGGWRDRPNDPC
ncbi:hypothetical protein [Stenotrophomonas maltophilia]